MYEYAYCSCKCAVHVCVGMHADALSSLHFWVCLSGAVNSNGLTGNWELWELGTKLRSSGKAMNALNRLSSPV